jgi:hypothetical protein
VEKQLAAQISKVIYPGAHWDLPRFGGKCGTNWQFVYALPAYVVVYHGDSQRTHPGHVSKMVKSFLQGTA